VRAKVFASFFYDSTIWKEGRNFQIILERSVFICCPAVVNMSPESRTILVRGAVKLAEINTANDLFARVRVAPVTMRRWCIRIGLKKHSSL
jgi:hypothetical protein